MTSAHRTPADQTASAAPLPPELAALDFDPFDATDPAAEQAADVLVSLTRIEVAVRTDLAHALRLMAEAEAEYLAAESEDVRRAWRERARIAEREAIAASHDLERVLVGRAEALRALMTAAH